jgi:hypothetical protein
MAKSTSNAGKAWDVSDEKRVAELAKKNTPTGVISLKLRRSENSIRSKAQELGVSLKPANQKPYNRKKK